MKVQSLITKTQSQVENCEPLIQTLKVMFTFLLTLFYHSLFSKIYACYIFLVVDLYVIFCFCLLKLWHDNLLDMQLKTIFYNMAIT